jgi:hypothetical protein
MKAKENFPHRVAVNLSYHRPFDDQSQLRISLETQAKLYVQQKVLSGEYDLMWSYIVEYENTRNPFDARFDSVYGWKEVAKKSIMGETSEILELGESLMERGVKLYDALHVACADAGGCDYFLTVDKKLLNKPINEVRIYNPIDFIREMED